MAQLCSLQYPCLLHMDGLCSDGGLLCFRVGFIEGALGQVFGAFDGVFDFTSYYFFFVCNPLIQSCKLLPFGIFISQTCVDVVMHRESFGGYKIFAVTLIYIGQLGLLHQHFMYNSASDAWKPILDLKRDCSDVSLLRNCSIVFEGVYYCVLGGGRQAYEVFAYDIQHDSWIASEVKMQLDPRVLEVLFVVSDKCLLLIASSYEEYLWFYRISRVDLCKMNDLVEIVVFLANFLWNKGTTSALACRDSIVLASDWKFMAHVKLRSDLKELKLMPTWDRCKHLRRMTTVN